MSPNSRLSVALATCDGERFLGELLADLAAQDRRPDELVVVDDASMDRTPDLLAEFAASSPFPVTIQRSERRRGPVRTFEAALAGCTGDLVALCDQDDRWAPEKLDVLGEVLDTSLAVMAFCDARMVDRTGQDLDRRLWQELGFRRREQVSLAGSPPGPLLRHAVVAGCTAVFRRDLLAAALPFPAALDLVAEPMLHDRWLSLVAGCTGPVTPVSALLVDYRVHDGQAVGARWTPAHQDVAGQRRRPVADVRARAEARRRTLEVLERRLDRLPVPPRPGVRSQLDDLRHHLGVRAELGPRHRRVAPVAREVLLGRYRRFGSGPGSALLDLLRD